ncbi:MAG: TrkH family potassium uptake protein [Acidobacteria bacterium]|nr:MAG: TrkH family potassium uptake protein [Acidobacteriota bacterium]TDI56967.1 MAG: TrkH family potassium uptake protein [Acidobacteriota bacterium]
MTIKEPRSSQPLAVNLLKTVAYVLGSVLLFVAIAMAASAIVSVFYAEYETAMWIAISAGITALFGYTTRRLVPRPRSITVKQGFATVGLAWFVFSIFGALPYLLSGAIPNISDAVFETASGFTTTGASILADPSLLPKGISFWRALTQWLGGMGVIVLGVAILPLLGTGGMQLARAESPGPTPDRLTPRFQGTAKRLWIIYAIITVIEMGFLSVGDMTGFQAVIHSLTTMSTGGFGTEATSIAGFSNYTKWVITFFMFVAGVSFALHFRAWSKPVEYWKNSEFRLYGLIIVGAIVIVAGGLLGGDLEPITAVRDAIFNTISLVTTTGFWSTDFGQWRPALQIMVVGLMFLGGMAGSTAGGMKTFRIGVLSKAAFADLRRLVHPRGIFVTRFGGKRVSDPVIEAVQSYFLFYMFLFMTSTFLLAFIDANLSEDLDLITATTAVAASIGNIGPGLGEVGPAGNYAGLPDLAKWLLSSLMIVGRLEIFPVLVLFTKDLWRR